MQPIIPTPRSVVELGGEIVLPQHLTVTAPAEGLVALRSLLRTFEDSAGLQVQPREHEGFLRAHLTEDKGEAHRIRIDDAGVEITGGTRGIRLAAQTVSSLLPPACLMPGSAAEARLPKLEIEDEPLVGWRGLLIDVARHYMPITWLRTVVDIAAFHKLNVIHLHLTDDQGWRMPIDAFPRLTTVGARRRETLVGPAPGTVYDGKPHGGSYTKAELRALVTYARARGVMVVPEIDLPGHMVAAIASYPEWGNGDEPLEVLTTWGISADIINTKPETIAALKTILDEVMEVFDAPWLHLGGDEVPTRDWERSEDAAALMESEGMGSVREIQGWIMGQLVCHVEAAGRQVIVWDEALDAGIGSSAVIQAWRSPSHVEDALEQGRVTIASPQQHYYLNYSTELGEDEPLGYGVGKGIATSLAETFAYVVPEGVFGVEAALWAEYVKSPAKASFQLLPRLAAVAERAWAGNASSFECWQPALRAQMRRYESLGWDHRPLDGPGPRWSRLWQKGSLA